MFRFDSSKIPQRILKNTHTKNQVYNKQSHRTSLVNSKVISITDNSGFNTLLLRNDSSLESQLKISQ